MTAQQCNRDPDGCDKIAPQEPRSRSLRLSRRPVRFAEAALALVTLTILSVGLPVVATLGNGPTFFVAHRAPTFQIMTVVLVVLAGPALLAILVLALAWAAPTSRVRSTAALALIASLSGFLALQQLSRAVSSAALVAILAAAFGVLAGITYLRWEVVRRGLRELAFGTLAIPAWFVFISPASGLFGFGVSHAEAVLRVENPIPVTIVVFDEFHTAAILDRDGEIDAERFPNFGRLAADSTWYPRAVAQSFSTVNALPSLVSGELPLYIENRPPTWREFPNSIFSALEPHYDIRAFQSYVDLCPPSACADEQVSYVREAFIDDLGVVARRSVYPKNFLAHLPTLEGRWARFAQEESSESDPDWGVFKPGEYGGVYEILESIPSRPRSQFNFIHVLEPHAPHNRLSDGRRYSLQPPPIPGKGSGESWTGGSPLIEEAYLRYLHHVGLADKMLGDIIEAHETAGLWNDALVVVVADHGVAHVEDRRRPSATGLNWQEIYRVPYFIKYPGGQDAGAADSSLVTLADVLPTVANVLGFRIPWPTVGSPITSDAVQNRTVVEVDAAGRDLVPLPSDDAGSLRRLQWQYERFGDGVSLSELTRRDGVNSVLVGRSTSNFVNRGEEDDGPRIRVLGGPFGLTAAVSRADLLPARVYGHIQETEGERPIDAVAAAVDGIIVAASIPSTWGGSNSYWEMLLPPASLDRSTGRIEMFLVRGCTDPNGSCELIRTAAGSESLPVEVRGHDRDEIHVDESVWVLMSTLGHIEAVSADSGIVTFAGWAANPSDLAPPVAMAVFDGSKGLAANFQFVHRQDVVEYLGLQSATSQTPSQPWFGWFVSIREEDVRRAGPNLKIVALYSDESAGEFVSLSAAMMKFMSSATVE